MRSRILQSLWPILTPIVWTLTVIIWVIVLIAFLVVLVTDGFPSITFNTDPDPPGIDEDDPLEGRLFYYGMVKR